MNWFTKFLTSSIGQKVVMSLTGLFLITFLIVHLIGNLQLLNPDNGVAFNHYAKFMTSNPVIKFTSFGLYAGILLHAIQGLLIWAKNKKASGGGYEVKKINPGTTWASRNMALLGTLVLIFLFIHMGDFWFKMKFGEVPMMTGAGNEDVKDLYAKVSASFSQLWIVIVYVICMIGLMFHLQHGFASAFQTLGLNHRKYTPIIKIVGNVIAYVIPTLFAIIPVLMFFGVQLPFMLPH